MPTSDVKPQAKDHLGQIKLQAHPEIPFRMGHLQESKSVLKRRSLFGLGSPC